MIAVTFSLPDESSGFVRQLQHAVKTDTGAGEIVRGEFAGKSVVVLHTGVSERICRQRMESFLADTRPDILISAGFAGATNEGLAVGDLLVAENFTDPVMLAKIGEVLSTAGGYVGDLFTTATVIDSLIARKHIADTTGADAVDMETEFIASACAQRNVPMLSLRVISDSISQPFPAPAAILFDVESQRTDFGTLASYLVKHPAAVPRLIAFARRISKVRAAVTTALCAVVQTDFQRTA